MSILVITLLSGLLLLMGQLALYDLLLLYREIRRELAVFSHPTQIYPDFRYEDDFRYEQ